LLVHKIDTQREKELKTRKLFFFRRRHEHDLRDDDDDDDDVLSRSSDNKRPREMPSVFNPSIGEEQGR
jgi:hypothetical protein